jgi:hypothetical protein
MTTYNPTKIEFYDHSHEDVDGEYIHEYTATVTINDSFVVTFSGNDDEANYHGIPHPAYGGFHKSETEQLNAYDNINSDDVERDLEVSGFENNYHWLNENSNS